MCFINYEICMHGCRAHVDEADVRLCQDPDKHKIVLSIRNSYVNIPSDQQVIRQTRTILRGGIIVSEDVLKYMTDRMIYIQVINETKACDAYMIV